MVNEGSALQPAQEPESTTEASKVTEPAEVTEQRSTEPLTAIDIAAAVIKVWQKKQPLFPELKPLDAPRERGGRDRGDRGD
jgi:hypothetical protein